MAFVKPNNYIGENVGIYQMEDGAVCWYMSVYDYLKNNVTNI